MSPGEQQRADRRALVVGAIAIGLLLFGVAPILASRLGPTGYPFWSTLPKTLLLAVAFVATGYLPGIVHELSHALAATAVGYWVRCIHLPLPLPRFQYRVLGTWLVGDPRATAGLCVAYPRVHPSGSLGRWMFYLAGPTGNLLVAVACWPYAMPSDEVLTTEVWLYFFGVMNLVVGVIGLVPCTITAAGRRLPSDGAVLLRLLRRGANLEASATAYATGLVLDHRYTDAIAFLRLEREQHPERAWSGTLLLVALLETEALPETRALAAELLARHDGTDSVVPVKMALALALALHGDDGDLAQADAHSRDVLARMPSTPSAGLIRGVVLWRLGQRTDAKDLLGHAYDTGSDPLVRGSAAAYLSILHAEDGMGAQARRYLEWAEWVGTQGIEMRLARAAVAAPAVAPGAEAR